MLLQLLGWKPLGYSELEIAAKYPRLVLVYPHTSNWDIYICMLYRSSHPLLKQRMRVLVGGYCMRGWQGSTLRSMGAISCSYREIRGAGSTAKIVEHLNKLESFILLISPKGTLEAADWRSGYYQIAKQTGAALVCGGLDYHHHCFKFNQPFYPHGMELKDVERKCKDQLASIVPHYRAMAEYPLEPLDLEASVIPLHRWCIIFPTVVVLVLCLILASIYFRTGSERDHHPSFISSLTKGVIKKATP